MKLLHQIALLGFIWSFAALGIDTAQANIPLANVAERLQQRLALAPAPETLWAGEVRLYSPALLSRFYREQAYQPVWLTINGPSGNANQLLEAVRGADQEGLQPTDYHYPLLRDALANPSDRTAEQWANLDLLLTDAWLTYGSHLLSGRLNPRAIEGHQWEISGRSQDLIWTLQTALNAGRIKAALAALAPPHREYAELRKALFHYRDLASAGGWPALLPGDLLRKGDWDPRVKTLRQRLRIAGDLAEALVLTDAQPLQPALVNASVNATVTPAVTQDGFGTFRDPESFFDDVVFAAVKRFQQRHGLAADGVVGPATLKSLNVSAAERVRQIELNMERWRWLPADLGNRHIRVNITDYQMSVIEQGREVLTSRVVVGKPDRPTPVLTANLSYLVMSPRWYVPRSIAVKDKLPQLRRNSYALARQGIRIFEADGREIDPSTVDWQQVNRHNFRYLLRQDPGPGNALGGIKFIFPNDHAVYLHDTPSTSLFNRSRRTFSSGCVRVAESLTLAEYLLQDRPRWTRQAIRSASKSKRQRRVNLTEEVPVYLLYWTAWVDEDGVIQFRNDIYDRDRLLAQVWPGRASSNA